MTSCPPVAAIPKANPAIPYSILTVEPAVNTAANSLTCSVSGELNTRSGPNRSRMLTVQRKTPPKATSSPADPQFRQYNSEMGWITEHHSFRILLHCDRHCRVDSHKHVHLFRRFLRSRCGRPSTATEAYSASIASQTPST